MEVEDFGFRVHANIISGASADHLRRRVGTLEAREDSPSYYLNERVQLAIPSYKGIVELELLGFTNLCAVLLAPRSIRAWDSLEMREVAPRTQSFVLLCPGLDAESLVSA